MHLINQKFKDSHVYINLRVKHLYIQFISNGGNEFTRSLWSSTRVDIQEAGEGITMAVALVIKDSLISSPF